MPGTKGSVPARRHRVRTDETYKDSVTHRTGSARHAMHTALSPGALQPASNRGTMPHIFSVSEVTEAIKTTMESEFPFVWVQGEVSDVATPASGHLYCTLKDAHARLAVVWFKKNRRLIRKGETDPATGEVMEQDRACELQEGQEVLVAGRLSVYLPRGNYQLLAELVQPRGAGDRAMAFEALKNTLLLKGYFDAEKKQPLPGHPERVALITSPVGAAVQDFVRIADTRGSGAHIRIYPVLVQGAQAPAQIVRALEQVRQDGWAELICLIRGGGSLEDLWAFNTEEVAQALFHTPIPVVSGIGHETDSTIADFVADLRAVTPTHAAQLLWPERTQLMQDVDLLEKQLMQKVDTRFRQWNQRLASLEKALHWLSVRKKLARWLERFVFLQEQLCQRIHQCVSRKEQAWTHAVRRLGDSYGTETTARYEAKLSSHVTELMLARKRIAQQHSHTLDLLESRLNGLDPHAPLQRGYGLIEVTKKQRFLRSRHDVSPGDGLRLHVADGTVAARVTTTDKTTEKNQGRP